MARKRKANNDKIEFIKLGGGSLRIHIDGNQKIIKPNEKFLAKWENIPVAFRDVIEPVDKSQVKPIKQDVVEPESEPESVEVTENEYSKKHVGGGWYNVLDTSGNQWNDTPLNKDEADKLISELEGK